jgi:hypothetical protein
MRQQNNSCFAVGDQVKFRHFSRVFFPRGDPACAYNRDGMYKGFYFSKHTLQTWRPAWLTDWLAGAAQVH